jgi:hypothetical protein
MKLGIMQPYLFPYIGYFQLINSVEKFVIFDDVNYINKGWINRNRILLKDKEFLFTVPLEKSSQNRLICETNLFNDNKWKVKFLKTLYAAYNKAPMFKEAYTIIEQIINLNELHLSTFISNSIVQICNYLMIDTQIILSSKHYKTSHLNGQDKILEICRIEKASVYLNSIGGFGIYQKDVFEKQNIKLFFLKSKPAIYKQFSNEFVPFLSVIDVMMFNDKDKIAGYLSGYELI